MYQFFEFSTYYLRTGMFAMNKSRTTGITDPRYHVSQSCVDLMPRSCCNWRQLVQFYNYIENSEYFKSSSTIIFRIEFMWDFGLTVSWHIILASQLWSAIVCTDVKLFQNETNCSVYLRFSCITKICNLFIKTSS